MRRGKRIRHPACCEDLFGLKRHNAQLGRRTAQERSARGVSQRLGSDPCRSGRGRNSRGQTLVVRDVSLSDTPHEQPTAPARSSSSSTEGLLPDQERHRPRPPRRRHPRRRRRLLDDPPRRDGRPGRRVGLREVNELLKIVGLPADAAGRYPHEFSGGQRQRIGLARAIALNPDFVVADEPVSALDVSLQAQIINLLEQLQEEFDLASLFIAHDLAVVRHISDRIAVMYLGTIVEVSPADELYDNPLHPYTISLLAAVPIPDPEVERKRVPILLAGDLPSPANPPAACRFHTRCPYVQPTRCKTEVPPLRKLGQEHFVSCHWAEEIKAGRIQPGAMEPVAGPPSA